MRFKGWKQIFGFTYLQQVKSKSFIISTVVVCVLIIALFVLVGVLSFSETDNFFGGGETDVKTIDTLYVYNETDISDFSESLSERLGIKCAGLTEEDYENRQEEVKAGDGTAALLYVRYEEGGEDGGVKDVSMQLYRPQDKEAVSDEYLSGLAAECRLQFRESLLMSLGVDKENVALAETAVSSEILIYGDEMSEIRMIMNTVIPMLFAAIMYMFIISYAQIIAQSVAMEKTSRVIELLITSVRPLAIVTGKVFAMLLVVVTQLAVIGGVVGMCGGVFALVTVAAAGGSGLAETAQGMEQAAQEMSEAVQSAAPSWQTEITEAMPGLFNPVSIVTVVIVFLLGFLFYALLASLVGAGISRSEDLASGIQPLALISVVGFMLSYLPSAFDMGYTAGGGNMTSDPNIITVIARYLPISSPFALPSAIILGQIGTAEIIAAALILALLTFGTMLLVAKVYENIILYSGSVLKLGQMIKMAKSK